MLSELLVTLLVFTVLKCEAQEASSCIVPKTGATGTCISIRKCREIYEDLIRHQIIPKTCNNLRGSVCCPPVTKIISRKPSNRISAQKCREYAKSVPLTGKDACPFTSVQLIIGGEKAREREFPHMALIGFLKSIDDFDFLCGGSLISEKFVLSAAHCAFSAHFHKATHIKLGDVRRDEKNINTYNYIIGQRYKHPQWRSASIDHDIALLELTKNAILNAYIRPICLPAQDEETEIAIASGWGQTGVFEEQSKYLLKVNLDIFNQSDCQRSYDKSGKTVNGIDYQTKICAGSYEKNRDTCGGDSGGPLQIYNKDNILCTYTIVGITSFGHTNCGALGVPGIYTRVFHYLDWIEQTVWPPTTTSNSWNWK